MYDGASSGGGYEKYIILNSTTNYTGGFNQDVQSVFLEGNGAIIDLQYGSIIVNGPGKILNIHQCVFVNTIIDSSTFINYSNGASGKIVNNTFYGLTDSAKAWYALNFVECTSDSIIIQNNIFSNFYSPVYMYSINPNPYIKQYYISNNCIFNCDKTYLGMGSWSGYPVQIIPFPGNGEIFSDPQFNAPSLFDFSLSINSLCIDNGKYIGYSFNGNDPDIGAQESTETIFRATKLSGIVVGQLDALNSPYLITGDLIIPHNQCLIINPGVSIKINNGKSIQDYGKLLVIGNSEDSVYFNNNSAFGRIYWGNIIFHKYSSDSSFLRNVDFKKTKGIFCQNDSITLANNKFNMDEIFTGDAIVNCSDSSKINISDNTFESDFTFTGQRAIYGLNHSRPTIFNNTFYTSSIYSDSANLVIMNNNFMGQSFIEQQYTQVQLRFSEALVIDNYFQNNYSAVWLEYSTARCINNIINNCENAFSISYSSSTINNNTVFLPDGEFSGIGIIGYTSSISSYNNIIWKIDTIHGYPISPSQPIAAVYCDLFKVYPGNGNIISDPLFIDIPTGNFNLQPLSPCIDMGTPDTTGLMLPLTDFWGNARIVNNRIDIGAIEYPGNVTVYLEQNYFTIFPNPSNGIFSINQDVSSQKYIVQILDLNGHIIYNNLLTKSSEQMDISKFPNGLYLMKIISKYGFSIKKIIKS
jgi:hypothetical protein